VAPRSERDKIEISQYILEQVPERAQVTRIEYEGSMLAVYAKKPEILVEQSSLIADIVGVIRKRIVVRSDPSVRLPEKDAERISREIIETEAEVTDINFDPSLGEIIIEAKKPGLVIGKNGVILQEIIRQTKWRPHVLRSPPIRSKIVAHIAITFIQKVRKERGYSVQLVREFSDLKLMRLETFELQCLEAFNKSVGQPFLFKQERAVYYWIAVLIPALRSLLRLFRDSTLQHLRLIL